jgi:hypothetical protein
LSLHTPRPKVDGCESSLGRLKISRIIVTSIILNLHMASPIVSNIHMLEPIEPTVNFLIRPLGSGPIRYLLVMETCHSKRVLVLMLVIR